MSRPPKPHLTSGQQVHLSTDNARYAARLGAGGAPIHTPQAPRPFVSALAGAALAARIAAIAAVLAVLIYALLAATVLVVLPADGHHAVVLRGAHPIGQVPPGEVVYASTDAVTNTARVNLLQVVDGVPGGSVVQVLGGPNAHIATDPQGRLLLDGEPSGYQVHVDDHLLTREYIAVCLAGACVPGQAVLIGQDDVVGGVQGYLGRGGLSQPDGTLPSQP